MHSFSAFDKVTAWYGEEEDLTTAIEMAFARGVAFRRPLAWRSDYSQVISVL